MHPDKLLEIFTAYTKSYKIDNKKSVPFVYITIVKTLKGSGQLNTTLSAFLVKDSTKKPFGSYPSQYFSNIAYGFASKLIALIPYFKTIQSISENGGHSEIHQLGNDLFLSITVLAEVKIAKTICNELVSLITKEIA